MKFFWLGTRKRASGFGKAALLHQWLLAEGDRRVPRCTRDDYQKEDVFSAQAPARVVHRESCCRSCPILPMCVIELGSGRSKKRHSCGMTRPPHPCVVAG